MPCCWHFVFLTHLVKCHLFYSKDISRWPFGLCRYIESHFWGQEWPFNHLDDLSPSVYFYFLPGARVLYVFHAFFFCLFLTILALGLLLIFILMYINKQKSSTFSFCSNSIPQMFSLSFVILVFLNIQIYTDINQTEKKRERKMFLWRQTKHFKRTYWQIYMH